MRYMKIGVAAAGIVWLSLIASVLFWNFAPSTNSLGIPTRFSGNMGGYAPSSLGRSRYLMLVEATRHYTEGHTDVSPGMAEGTEFAPVPFLNRELERQGAKWRVRSADGLSVEIYEVS